MPEIRDVTGCLGITLQCKPFRSYSAAVRILRKGLSPLAADDNGSISIWRRMDEGKLRAGFYRHYQTLDERDLNNLTQLRDWLKKWYPKMSEASR